MRKIDETIVSQPNHETKSGGMEENMLLQSKWSFKPDLFVDDRGNTFRYVKCVGFGQFGDVFLARSEKSNQELAVKEIRIKTLNPETWQQELQRFLQKKWPTLLELSHENVLQYHAASGSPASDLAPAYTILVMEYCSG